jgi:hypothetical protein
MTSEWATEKIDVYGYDMGTIQAVWAGANTSKGKIQPQMTVDGINWLNLFPDTAVQKVTSGSGTLAYNLDNIHYRQLRVCFNPVNNTAGTLTIYAFLKRHWSPNR